MFTDRYHHRKAWSTGFSLALFALAGNGALAQGADSDEALEEIVVTGTMIQGIDPVGSNVIGLDEQDIEATGVNSATDLLRKVPQMADFNTVPPPAGQGSIPFSPPVLRGVGGLSGMSTLVLLDGHRIIPVGPGHNWIDTQMIPAAHLERTEIIPDGGSSIYGSDAVAGVINFITKKNIEGPSVLGRYGMGKGDYDTLDLTASFGHTWDDGSLVLSYTYADREALLGKDLGYIDDDQSDVGGEDARTTQCSPGNVAVTEGDPPVTTVYPLPGNTPGAPNRCSTSDYASYYPAEERHSLFATLQQDIGSKSSLEVLAYYSKRDSTEYNTIEALRRSGDITDANPYFTSFQGETAHTVDFSYEDAWGKGRELPSEYDAFQLMPTLSVDLNNDWSMRVSLNYGKSESLFLNYDINASAQADALAGTTIATALNPYDPAASDPAVLAAIGDFLTDAQDTTQDMTEARVVFNGTLGDLGGGELRVAGGVETRTEGYDRKTLTGTRSSGFEDIANIDRRVNSIFAEVYLPLSDTFELSLAARYDDYDDVGNTTNPKVGITWQATDAVTVRGSWGTSFHAPALADLGARQEYQIIPVSPFRAADSPFFPDFFRPTIIFAGAAEGIKPETAETFSIGVDFEITSELRLGVTYWDLLYEERMDQNAGFFFGPEYYTDPINFPFFIRDPADAQEIRDTFGDHPVAGFPDLETVFFIFGQPYVVTNQNKMNMGSYDLSGLDFGLQYAADAGNGSLDASLSGTYLLNRKKEQLQGSGFVDTLKYGDFNSGVSKLNLSASLGWGSGPLYVSGTAYYRGGSDVGSTSIDSYTTIGLFGSYDLNDVWALTLNMDNALDEDPPFRISNTGVAYLNTGRVTTLGVKAQF